VLNFAEVIHLGSYVPWVRNLARVHRGIDPAAWPYPTHHSVPYELIHANPLAPDEYYLASWPLGLSGVPKHYQALVTDVAPGLALCCDAILRPTERCSNLRRQCGLPRSQASDFLPLPRRLL
jgi:hypothetical protein